MVGRNTKNCAVYKIYKKCFKKTGGTTVLNIIERSNKIGEKLIIGFGNREITINLSKSYFKRLGGTDTKGVS